MIIKASILFLKPSLFLFVFARACSFSLVSSILLVQVLLQAVEFDPESFFTGIIFTLSNIGPKTGERDDFIGDILGESDDINGDILGERDEGMDISLSTTNAFMSKTLLFRDLITATPRKLIPPA